MSISKSTLLALCLCGVGVSEAWPAAVDLHVTRFSDTEIGLRITCDEPELQRSRTGEISNLYLAGAGLRTEPGEVVLPVVSRVVALPFPDTPVRVRLASVEREAIDFGPLPVLRADAGADPALGAPGGDSALLPSSDTRLLPASPFNIERIGFRGLHLARISFYPVSVRPATGEGVLRRLVDLRIEIAPGDAHPDPRSIASGPLDSALESILLNPRTARRWRRKPTRFGSKTTETSLSAPRAPMSGSGAPVLRIAVDRDGMMAITGAQIAAAGVRLSQIDVATLALTEGEAPEPILVEDGGDGELDRGDRILFYGRAPRGESQYFDPYTIENAYFLTWGDTPGARLIREDAAPAEGNPSRYVEPGAFRWTVHVERDSIFSRLGQDGTPGLDHWFWRSIRAPTLCVVPIHLPSPDLLGSAASVELRLQGATYPPQYPDHHLEIYINSQSLDDVTFDGQTAIVHNADNVPMARLRDSENEISLVAPGDTPAENLDEVYLDWVEVSYDRLYEAENGVLDFASPVDGGSGLYQFRLSGFRSEAIRVFKLGVGEMVNGTIRPGRGNGKYEIKIQDHLVTSDVRYVALEEGRFEHPTAVEVVPDGPDLRDLSLAAELLIIAPREFEGTLLPFVDWKETQGVATTLVVLEDIVHQFGGGRPSPEAIRAFIRLAMGGWASPALENLLLAGDGTWDFRNIQGGDALENRVPAGLDYNVNWGQTSSDGWYGLPSDDSILPALSIGRWTVHNVEELQVVIDKTMAYPATGEWRGIVEMIGGNGLEFRDRSEQLIREGVPPHIKPQRVFTTEDETREDDPHFRGGPELTRDLDAGVALANFQGHGGGGIWSDADLLDIEDVPLLRNGDKLPIVFSMTCYTGSFADPGPAAIGEVFLTEADKGAVGFLGSSGFSYSLQGHGLNRHLIDAVFDPSRGDRSLGESILLAKGTFYLTNDGLIPRDIVRAYNLLGDPSLVPGLPRADIKLNAEPAATALGGSVALSGSGAPAGGAVTIALSDADEVVHVETTVTANASGSFETSVDIPVDAPQGAWTLRARSGERFGGAPIGVSVPVVAPLTTSPDPVRDGVPALVRTTMASGGGHDRFRLVWATNSSFGPADTLELTPDGPGDEYVTEDTIPSQPGGREIFMKVVAEGETVDRWVGAPESYKVLRREDLTFANGRQGVFGGTSSVTFGVDIFNAGQVDAQDVSVTFAWHPVVVQDDTIYTPREEEWNDFDSVTRTEIDVAGKAPARTEIPWDLPSGSYLVRVEIDSDAEFEESSEVNNLRVLKVSADRYAVTPSEGSEGSRPSVDGNLHIEVQPGAVPTPAVLIVERVSMMEPTAQPDYEAPIFLDGSAGVAYRFGFADSTIEVSGIEATFHLGGGTLVDPALYRWDPDRGKWVRDPRSSESGGDVRSEDLPPGTYTVLDNRDQTPPEIELQSQGRVIAEGGFVAPRPVLDFLVQDANGVDVEPERIIVMLDGETLDASSYSVSPNPQHPNLVSISVPTEMGRGGHEAELQVQDVNGNLRGSSTSFLIGESTRIRDLANYPNPASAAGTTIAFTLETDWDSVKEVTIRIYTPSGRMIRSFSSKRDLIRTVDYSEVPWDLRDAWGYPVANGVYFYRVQAIGSKKGQKISSTKKLAVLR
ncbi:MAG: hypothetical protein CME06_02365 [Gemmatimonadetes bacterium]|nr:hypothetical protein [Gemmatimonadota bacterium]